MHIDDDVSDSRQLGSVLSEYFIKAKKKKKKNRNLRIEKP